MIIRLNYKYKIDVYDFCLSHLDKYEDWYITKEKSRLMIDNLELIEKILKYQEVYGVFEKELKAILIIYVEKGFRTYIKILSQNLGYTYDLLKYIDWNFYNKEIYLKIKKENSINKAISFFDRIKKVQIYRYNWEISGFRGQEILYVRKPFARKKEIGEKYDSNRINSEITQFVTR